MAFLWMVVCSLGTLKSQNRFLRAYAAKGMQPAGAGPYDSRRALALAQPLADPELERLRRNAKDARDLLPVVSVVGSLVIVFAVGIITGGR